jgi:hypothetical protein
LVIVHAGHGGPSAAIREQNQTSILPVETDRYRRVQHGVTLSAPPRSHAVSPAGKPLSLPGTILDPVIPTGQLTVGCAQNAPPRTTRRQPAPPTQNGTSERAPRAHIGGCHTTFASTFQPAHSAEEAPDIAAGRAAA